MTVGGFVQRLASAKKIEAPDARTAVDGLLAAGVRLPADLALDQPLTEGHVASISRTLGLDVSTNRPETPFTTTQVDRFFEAYRVEAALAGQPNPAAQAAGSTRPPFNPYAKGRGSGKGKKKGHGHTPSEPE